MRVLFRLLFCGWVVFAAIQPRCMNCTGTAGDGTAQSEQATCRCSGGCHHESVLLSHCGGDDWGEQPAVPCEKPPCCLWCGVPVWTVSSNPFEPPSPQLSCREPNPIDDAPIVGCGGTFSLEPMVTPVPERCGLGTLRV